MSETGPEGEGAADREDGGALEASRQPVEPATAEFVAVREVVHHFQGPLPPPNVLRGYEEVVPGGAERLFAMVERQAAHRQGIEARGQLFGFSLAASSIVGAFLAVAAGVPLVGVSGVIVAVATLSGLFIWGKAGGIKRVPPEPDSDSRSTAGNRSDD